MAGEDDDIGGDVIVSLPAAEGEIKVTPVKDDRVIADASFNEDPLEDLRGQFATMTTRATAAETAAQHATQALHETTQRLQVAEKEVVSSQLDTVLTGIAAANADADAAEREVAQAAEAGDFTAQARAQRKLAAAESRAQRLTEAKEDLEDAAKREPKRDAPTRQQPRQQPSDPVEAMIAANGITPKSAAWLRANPTAVTDSNLNRKMLAAHNQSILDNVETESPEYFRRVEAAIKPPQQQKQPDPKPADPGLRPSSAAAGGGGAGGSLNGGGTEVRLTKGEARSATDGTLQWNYDDPTGQNRYKKGDPIGLAEMARRKHEGMKRGLYDKNSIEA